MYDVELETIAQELGIARQSVLNIQTRAIRKCRQWCADHGYELEDLLPAGAQFFRSPLIGEDVQVRRG